MYLANKNIAEPLILKIEYYRVNKTLDLISSMAI